MDVIQSFWFALFIVISYSVICLVVVFTPITYHVLISKQKRKLLVLLILTVFFSTISGVIQTFISGMLDEDAQNAVSLAQAITDPLYAVFEFLEDGTTVRVGQLFARGQFPQIGQVFTTSLVSAFVIGVPLAVGLIGVYLSFPLLVHNPKEIYYAMGPYFIVTSLGTPFSFLTNVGAGFFAGAQYFGYYLAVVLLEIFVTVALQFLLVVVADVGAIGLAIGNFFASYAWFYALSMLYVSPLFRKKFKTFGLPWKTWSKSLFYRSVLDGTLLMWSDLLGTLAGTIPILICLYVGTETLLALGYYSTLLSVSSGAYGPVFFFICKLRVSRWISARQSKLLLWFWIENSVVLAILSLFSMAVFALATPLFIEVLYSGLTDAQQANITSMNAPLFYAFILLQPVFFFQPFYKGFVYAAGGFIWINAISNATFILVFLPSSISTMGLYLLGHMSAIDVLTVINLTAWFVQAVSLFLYAAHFHLYVIPRMFGYAFLPLLRVHFESHNAEEDVHLMAENAETSIHGDPLSVLEGMLGSTGASAVGSAPKEEIEEVVLLPEWILRRRQTSSQPSFVFDDESLMQRITLPSDDE